MANLCENKVPQGVAVVIEVQDQLTGKYVSVAAQRGGTLNRSAATIDTSNKDDYGWESSIAGVKSWSFDADGLFIETHAGFQLLEDAWYNGDCVRTRVRFPSGRIYMGLAIITDFPIDFPYDDSVTYTVTLQGVGMLERDQVEPVIDPQSIKITPASPTVKVGAKVSLTSAVLPVGASQEVVWVSYNEAVATVDSETGEVTGVSAGTAPIRAKAVGSATINGKADVVVTAP